MVVLVRAVQILLLLGFGGFLTVAFYDGIFLWGHMPSLTYQFAGELIDVLVALVRNQPISLAHSIISLGLFVVIELLYRIWKNQRHRS